MKKRLSKKPSIIIVGLLLTHSPLVLSTNNKTFFTSQNESNELPDDPQVEGVILKGDVIESCQSISKTGWGGKLTNDSFDSFIIRELKKARIKMNEDLNGKDGAGDVLSCMNNGAQQNSDTNVNTCTSSTDSAISITEEDFKKFKEQVFTSYGKYSSKITKSLDKVRKCLSLYTVMKGASKRDMSVSENNKSDTASSFDGKLKCESLGYETQDFKGCKESVMYYDGVFLGRKAVEVAQQFDYMDSSMDVQSDLAKNAQTDATAGLKAQRSDIKKRAEMARTRAATETAAVIALWASMEKIPSIDDLNNECINRSKSYEEIFKSAHQIARDHHKAVFDKVKLIKSLQIVATDGTQVTGNGGSLDSIDNNINHYVSNDYESAFRSEDACNSYVYDQENGGTHAMINNSHAKEVIQQALIDAGVNVATMLGTAEILDKQAGRVSDAIKLVDGHNPETLEYGGEDILTTECQLNPGSSACANINRNDAVDYYNQGINVDGIKFATSDSTSQELDEFGNRAVDSSGDTTRNGSPTGISAIAGADKGSGLAEGPAAAASVKSSGGNGIGSGLGGGGGGGGGGGSAPANGSAQTGGQGEKKAFVGSAKNMKFSGGGGALRFGSSSSKRKAKEKAKNPFANLFKKGGKKNDGVLNFRGVASVGKKQGSIFKMISNRYSIVNKEKRLLTYELEKVNGDLP